MATDARGHTVPAASDVPSRTTLLSIAKTTRDITPVTNTTTRGTAVTAMAAEGLAVAVTNPLMVARADARADSLLEFTTDNATWRTVVLGSGSGATAYTPTLTSSGTAPTLGTGSSVAAEWEQFSDYVVGAGEIVAGTSGFAAGTGSYRILLPIAMPAAAVTAGRVVGDGVFYDASVGNFYHISLTPSTSTTAAMALDGNGGMGAATPVVPAVNDQWRFRFQYRIA